MCLFKFVVLYFLLVHLLERSEDRLRLATSTVAICNMSGRELGTHCSISCYPEFKSLRRTKIAMLGVRGVVEYSFVLKITSIAGCYGLMRFLR